MDAKKLLEESLVFDGLFHSMFKDPPFGDRYMLDLMLDGGLTGLSTSVIYDKYRNHFLDCVKEIYQYYVFADAFPDQVVLVEKADDLVEAKRTKKLAVVLSTQGADCFEEDLRYITLLHKLGLRIVQITYNTRNHLGCGGSEKQDTGLTRFGEQAISEMNRAGILVDLSHVGYRTSMEAIAYSSKPCIFSHSSVDALCSHARNLKDDQIKAVAAKGGVVGVCPHSILTEKVPGTWPTINDYIDHMIYIMDLVGEDHVGIGTDRWMQQTMIYTMDRAEFARTYPGFYGGYTVNEKHVQGFGYYDQWENLVEHMLQRNLTENQVKKILGGNFLRVFKEVW